MKSNILSLYFDCTASDADVSYVVISKKRKLCLILIILTYASNNTLHIKAANNIDTPYSIMKYISLVVDHTYPSN